MINLIHNALLLTGLASFAASGIIHLRLRYWQHQLACHLSSAQRSPSARSTTGLSCSDH